MVRVAVKYCGHCNPERDMDDVIRKMEGQMSNVRFVLPNKKHELMLFLNGCRRMCVKAEEGTERNSVVACPHSVNGVGLKDNPLEEVLIKEIEKCIGKQVV